MWTTDQLGLAVWRDNGSAWYLDARGGKFGIGVVVTDDAEPKAFDAPERFFSLAPVNQHSLPSAGEQYVRGNQWHVNYSQGDGSYALRLAFKPIETSKDLIVLEATISLQTDLLDTHPMVDIQAACRSIDSFVPAALSSTAEAENVGPTPVFVASSDDHHVGVLLGPHDGPFTTNHSTDSLLRLRLFGDFLEKGVIRKARPWIVIDRSGKPSQTQFEVWRNQLSDSPLPLTP